MTEQSNATGTMEQNDVKSQECRIAELNRKASQLLTFLSFTLAAAVLLEINETKMLNTCQQVAVKWSLRFLVLSLFPTLLVVLPVKEWGAKEAPRYRRIRNTKVVFLTGAIGLIIFGAVAFLCAIW